MATSKLRFVVHIRPRWWLHSYLAGLRLICRVFGTEPNPEKVGYWVRRGLRISIEPEKVA